MITIKHGSIFDSGAAVMVCPVNCVGVMGKGLALEFRKREPHFADWYMQMCIAENALRPGKAMYSPHFKRFIAATKDHWKWPTKLEWVDSILSDISDAWHVGSFDSIALPQLGCGCGGLDWAEVWPLYERHLGGLDCDVEVWIYE